MSDNLRMDPQIILCDMCTGEDKKPARKSCMKCEISMCVQHLEAHLTTPVLLQTHPLTEPMDLSETTKCPQHGKLLEYYCLDDMICVCVSCAIEDQHRLHNMKTFTTAHKELLEKLKVEQQALQVKTEDENGSLEKWEKSESQKLSSCSLRLIEAVTNLRDISLTSVQSSVSARMASIKTSKNSMQAAQAEKDTFRFLQMYSQVYQDVETAKAVDLRKGLEPGSERDKLVQEINQDGEQMIQQAGEFWCSLLTLVDPENHQKPFATSPDLFFEPQNLGSGMSLSKDKRKVFYNSWLGESSATLLISSTETIPNFQRWTVSLSKESDWIVGLCDKKSPPLGGGPIYGLCWEDNECSVASSIAKQPSSRSAFNTPMIEVEDKATLRPEMVEVFWNMAASTLSFYNRTGQYKREEIITIELNPNNLDLAPFVHLGKGSAQNIPQQPRSSFGATYVNTYSGTPNNLDLAPFSHWGKGSALNRPQQTGFFGATYADTYSGYGQQTGIIPNITEVVCELC